MTTSISNNAPPPFTPAAGSAGNGSAASAGAAASHAEAGGKTGGKTGDQVKLTDSALALQEAARPADGAVVDQQRVEQIRKALADGSYNINPARIAERMLALEQQLHGTDRA